MVTAYDDTDTQARIHYEYRQKINDRLRGFGSLRYQELLDSERLFGDWSRLGTTGGVSYDLTNRIRVEGGLGLYYTWYPDTQNVYETRLWQAAFDWPEIRALARYVVHHRFMIEERFKHSADWKLSLRGRYRLAFSVPLNRYTVEPGAFFMPLSAEFFAPLDDGERDLFANKTRFSEGLGYMFNKTWTAELRYSRQQSRSTAGTEFQADDNIIELRFKTTVRILDYVKSR